MTSPCVSLIVPAYNAARHIGATLDSVLAQSLEDWECLVVDDGSTDGTGEVVASRGDARIRRLAQANRGVSAARNLGLEQARGRHVMFLDADDLLTETALERLVSALARDQVFVAAYGPFRKILDDGRPYPGEKPLAQLRYPSGDVLRPMLEQNFLANGGHVLIRTSAARATGGFNETLRLSEDWEFWCRLALQGPFRYIGSEREVMYFRVSTSSASGGLAREWPNHQPALSAVLSNPSIQGRFAPKAWRQLSQAIRASHEWEAGRVAYTFRDFGAARARMVAALRRYPTPKRLVLFALAQLGQVTGRPLASRLRFRDADG